MTKEKIKKSMKMEAEVVKKGRYRVHNGTTYEVVHLETSADQVIENEGRKFVSQTEKNNWNSKADSNHNHDAVYAKKSDTYEKTEVDDFLANKADKVHGHVATDIGTDSTHRFVSDAEKIRWNNTNTTEEITEIVAEINSTIASNEQENSNAHNAIRRDFAAADSNLDGKITIVQENLDSEVERLTTLINSGGTANADLTKRVEKIEKTDIPTLKNSLSALDTKVTEGIEGLESSKASKEELTTATADLTSKINIKADKNYVDSNLSNKADKADTYTKKEVDDKDLLKADLIYVDAELGKKVDKTLLNSELSKKADKTYVDEELNKKANAEYVDAQLETKAEKTHTHTASQITGLGTAASKNVGTSNGQIPILDANGKLDESVLPKIAINEVFTVNNIDEAMSIEVQVGDIIVIDSSSAFYRAVVDSFKVDGIKVASEIKYGAPKQMLSNEYTQYLMDGKLSYLCVDASAVTFEEKFRPLQSSGDSISKAEVFSELAKKLDKTEFNSYKSETEDKINEKANTADVYTKEESNNLLNNKVDKVTGKGLSKNDFTDPLKAKLEGIENGANNYSHPTGDGNLHVPATGTSSNKKALVAGSTEGSMVWTQLTPGHIQTNSENRFVSDAKIEEWNAKSDANHTHDIYRLISDSLSTSQTKAEINKLKTIISKSAPSAGSQIAGAVWIEEQE